MYANKRYFRKIVKNNNTDAGISIFSRVNRRNKIYR